jgi:hypothetical protein
MYEAHALAAGLTCALRGDPWLTLDPLPRSAPRAEWPILRCSTETACDAGHTMVWRATRVLHFEAHVPDLSSCQPVVSNAGAAPVLCCQSNPTAVLTWGF